MNLSFGFILKNLENGKLKKFYAHEKNTLDRSFCVPDITWRIWKKFWAKQMQLKCAVYQRDKVNTKWRFYLLTYSALFSVLFKILPLDCRYAVLPESVWWTKQWFISLRRETKESPITTICVSLRLLLSIWMATKTVKKSFQNFHNSHSRAQKVSM